MPQSFAPPLGLPVTAHRPNYISLNRLAVRAILLISCFFTGSCAKLLPLDLLDEYDLPSAREPLWYQLEAVRWDTWIYSLNTGRQRRQESAEDGAGDEESVF